MKDKDHNPNLLIQFKMNVKIKMITLPSETIEIIKSKC